MAATALAVRLTETHRLTQVRLGELTKQQVEAVWPALDLDRLDATFPAWFDQIDRIVGSARHLSASTAGAYYSTFRQLELGRARPFRPLLASPVDTEALSTSLRVTGVVSIKKAVGNGIDLAEAARTALTKSSGAALRHALAGGRDTITDSVAADPRALGWARAASGAACAFCAMLASRGPVYSEDSVDFEAHDHCSCGAEPVYSSDAPWPDRSDHYRTLWNDATRDVEPGGDLLNTFRQAYEAHA